MDFLNRAWAQLSELFRSLTPGARISSALLLVVVVVSVAWLFNSQVTGTDAYLMNGERFAPSDLPAMEAAFAKAGLATYELEGTRIRVPRGQQAAFMGALADAGALPANFGDHLSRAVEDSNPFLTSAQRDQMLKVAKQKELATIVRNMQGIESAAVFFDEKVNPGLRRDKTMTASVMVKPQGTLPLDEARIPMIRHLVAGAVAGISPQKVTVIDQNGRTHAGDEATGAVGGQDDIYFVTQQKWQQFYRDSIRSALSYVENAVVTVNVDLDKELEHVEESVKVDPQPVAISVREEGLTSSTERGSPGGLVGLQAQQPNAGAALGSASQNNRNSEESNSREEQNVVSHERKQIRTKGLTPTGVRVAVAIPDTYIRQVWNLQNPTPADQQPVEPDSTELAKLEEDIKLKIRSHVFGQIIAPGEVQDPSRVVTVTTFASLPRTGIPEPTLAEQALAWLAGNWSILGLAGLAMASLLILRSTIRAMPAPHPEAPPTVLSLTPPSDEPEAEGQPAAKKRKLTVGPSLRDELAEIVREDPDTAANILKSWIGNAS